MNITEHPFGDPLIQRTKLHHIYLSTTNFSNNRNKFSLPKNINNGIYLQALIGFRHKVCKEQTDTASASTFVQADSKPFVMDNPKPVYPSSARRRGMQGVVLLQVSVSHKGKVTGIHVMQSSGFRVLDVAALNSVKQWRFMPARKGDIEVASTVQVPIRFILNNS